MIEHVLFSPKVDDMETIWRGRGRGGVICEVETVDVYFEKKHHKIHAGSTFCSSGNPSIIASANYCLCAKHGCLEVGNVGLLGAEIGQIFEVVFLWEDSSGNTRVVLQ